VNVSVEAALPFWLDRPDEEALEIALEVERARLGALWIGEMATFDAIALATAIGHRAPGLPLKLGPLAIGVRSPVAIAMGAASVAALTDSDVEIALGASSPAIVNAWHDREWDHAAGRMRESIACLRAILAGAASDYDGDHVRSRGFRLRRPRPDIPIAVAAFGPAMTRVAARHADEVVLNLVPLERVRAARQVIDEEAEAAGRPPPRLVVWLSVALEPGAATLAQLAAQIAVYLAPPGYGDLFSELGYSELVRRARAGARRADLAKSIPFELLTQVCALGSHDELAARIAAYGAAGANGVAVVPATAEDPAGRSALQAISRAFPLRTAVPA
jgi:probable F420-dependent oxidoreductase